MRISDWSSDVCSSDLRLATVQKFLAEDFGEGNAVIVSSDDGDKRLIVSMASPEQIGSYYLYDVESGKFALIGHASEALADGMLNPGKTIRYKESDGLAIEAILTTHTLRNSDRRRVGTGCCSTCHLR